jgi:glycosyltransferase involved in cell wall biosynthesis
MAVSSKDLLTIISPCYNEARNLKALLPGWLEFCRTHRLRLILVDDGSTDDTQIFLRSLPFHNRLRVIRHKINRGYGAAIKSGIREVLTPYAATMDADGQHDPREILRLAAGLRSGEADMIIGRRKYGAPRFFFRSLGKWFIKLIVRYLFSRKFSDLNSGMKVFQADLAKKYMGICPDSMAFSEIFALVFVNHGHLVEEQAVTVGKRRSGSSTIRLRTAFQTVWKIVIIATLFKPVKIFLPLSALLFLAGIGWEIPILLAGRGISIGASLLIILAILFMLLGLLAEQLSIMMKSRLE